MRPPPPPAPQGRCPLPPPGPMQPLDPGIFREFFVMPFTSLSTTVLIVMLVILKVTMKSKLIKHVVDRTTVHCRLLQISGTQRTLKIFQMCINNIIFVIMVSLFLNSKVRKFSSYPKINILSLGTRRGHEKKKKKQQPHSLVQVVSSVEELLHARYLLLRTSKRFTWEADEVDCLNDPHENYGILLKIVGAG